MLYPYKLNSHFPSLCSLYNQSSSVSNLLNHPLGFFPFFLIPPSLCLISCLGLSSYQMGVAVINPRDCLNNSSFPQPLSSSLPRMKVLTAHPTPNPKANRSNRSRTNNRPKRIPLRPHEDSRPPRATSPSTVKPQLNKPVMGQIKILKRGELLTRTQTPAPAPAPALAPVVEQADRPKPDLILTDRMGLNPEPVPVEGLAGFYAGSSMFVASPPPSSVPLPAFFTKKAVSDATSDLRRILRLDL